MLSWLALTPARKAGVERPGLLPDDESLPSLVAHSVVQPQSGHARYQRNPYSGIQSSAQQGGALVSRPVYRPRFRQGRLPHGALALRSPESGSRTHGERTAAIRVEQLSRDDRVDGGARLTRCRTGSCAVCEGTVNCDCPLSQVRTRRCCEGFGSRIAPPRLVLR